MFQLISSQLFLTPSTCKNVMKHNNMVRSVRMLSSKPTSPYILIDHVLNAKHSTNDQVYYEDKYNDSLLIKDKRFAEEVKEAMTCGFLSSQGGWRVDLEKTENNSTSLILVDNTVSGPAITHLPPLLTTSRIHNVAISNSPNVKKEDFVVAVKFSSGTHVSLFKPFDYSSSEWINIDTPGVQPFSSLMYSKKNKKFLTISISSSCLWSLNLHFDGEKDIQPKFTWITKKADPDWDLSHDYMGGFIWTSRTDHLVESPTGEHFLVKWFTRDDNVFKKEIIAQEAYEFMVFRVDTICGHFSYTKDIGDLCIFLGHSEAFCVPASSSPGLKPNYIYFVGNNFGVHNIATTTCTTFFHEEDPREQEKFPLRSAEFPYWPPPFSY